MDNVEYLKRRDYQRSSEEICCKRELFRHLVRNAAISITLKRQTTSCTRNKYNVSSPFRERNNYRVSSSFRERIITISAVSSRVIQHYANQRERERNEIT
jgi:hypothetical protein